MKPNSASEGHTVLDRGSAGTRRFNLGIRATFIDAGALDTHVVLALRTKVALDVRAMGLQA
jgi:hypothetical protein